MEELVVHKVLVLYVGGTIGMQKNEEGGKNVLSKPLFFCLSFSKTNKHHLYFAFYCLSDFIILHTIFKQQTPMSCYFYTTTQSQFQYRPSFTHVCLRHFV